MKGLATQHRRLSLGSVQGEIPCRGKQKEELSPCSHSTEKGDDEEQIGNDKDLRECFEKKSAVGTDALSKRMQYVRIRKHESTKKGEELSREDYNQWRQEQNNIASRIEKQLQVRWELEELIEEHFKHYRSQYGFATFPSTLKDVSDHLTSKWLPPHEVAVLNWFGDWRPSSILELVRNLAAHFTFSVSDSSKCLLSQVLQETRIEETIIDSEFAEIQANCIVNLPFPPFNRARSRADAISRVQDQFQKIERIISKAHVLRSAVFFYLCWFKVLDMVVKKILDPVDAAEFLVAFTGLKNAIHHYGEQQGLRKIQPVVRLANKASGSS